MVLEIYPVASKSGVGAVEERRDLPFHGLPGKGPQNHIYIQQSPSPQAWPRSLNSLGIVTQPQTTTGVIPMEVCIFKEP